MYLYVLKSKVLRAKKKRACAISNLGVFSTQQTEHFFTLVKLFGVFFHARAKSCAVNELSHLDKLACFTLEQINRLW